MPRVKIDIRGIMSDLPQEGVPQGACQDIVNLRFEDNAWRPVKTKKLDWEHTNDVLALFIHQIEGLSINIVQVNFGIYYLDLNAVPDPEYVFMKTSASYVNKITSINQYLIIQAVSTGRVYYTKVEIDGVNYSYNPVLEWNITLPNIQFYTSTTKNYKKYFTTLEEHLEITKSAYKALVSEANDQMYFNGKIFVQYALKMYDGNYICHSTIKQVYVDTSTMAPLLTGYGKDVSGLTFTDANGTPLAISPFDEEDTVSFKHDILLKTSLLRFTIPVDITGSDNADLITAIKGYGELITSLDIFISEPFEIWNIDNPPISLQGGSPTALTINTPKNVNDFESLSNMILFRSIPISELATGTDEVLGFVNIYHDEYANYYGLSNIGVGSSITMTNGYQEYVGEGEKYVQEKIYSKYIKDGKVISKKVLPIQDNTHSLVGNQLLNYNNRLIIGNVTERLFEGYPTMHLATQSVGTGSTTRKIDCYVKIETEDGEKIVKANSTYQFFTVYNTAFLNQFLTYPDTRAKHVYIFVIDGTTVTAGYDWPMRPHPNLNLAFAFTGTEGTHYPYSGIVLTMTATNSNTTVPTVTTRLARDRNRLMISAVNNPFVYKAEETNNVGNSDIVNILTNSKQMTEGQFGMHPILVFTTSGIWAIEIGQGRNYAQRFVPVSSDECLGAAISFYSKSLNTDMIVYLSRTGVKMLQGNQPVDITQMVKYNKSSALDLAARNGYVFLGSFATPPTSVVGDYFILTANWSIYTSGDYLLRVSLTGTDEEKYDVLDKSYWFYGNFDNYLAPKVQEKTTWDNTAYNQPGGLDL